MSRITRERIASKNVNFVTSVAWQLSATMWRFRVKNSPVQFIIPLFAAAQGGFYVSNPHLRLITRLRHIFILFLFGLFFEENSKLLNLERDEVARVHLHNRSALDHYRRLTRAYASKGHFLIVFFFGQFLDGKIELLPRPT